MTIEELLESMYPLIEWRKPWPATLADGHQMYGCRFCHQQNLQALFDNYEEWAAHMRVVHS